MKGKYKNVKIIYGNSKKYNLEKNYEENYTFMEGNWKVRSVIRARRDKIVYT